MDPLADSKTHFFNQATRPTTAEGVEQLPEHGSCFICGAENPKSMGLAWFLTHTNPAVQQAANDLLVFSEFRFSMAEQGPPGYAHGGASAAVLDEAMGAVVWRSGLQVVLANMNLDYRRPVPLGETVRVEAWLEGTEGKKAFAAARLVLASGQMAVQARGLYIHAPAIFAPSKDHADC